MIPEYLVAGMLAIPSDELKPLVRFMATIQEWRGHLLWQGGVTDNGYGRFRGGPSGEKMMAHHYLWTLLYGPVPDGHELHHDCRIRPCVNPHCLRLLTEDDHRELHAQEAREIPACPAGHPYDGVNTRHYRGRRYCRACNNNGRRPIANSRLPELQAARRERLDAAASLLGVRGNRDA
jgi:hypothetical protein